MHVFELQNHSVISCNNKFCSLKTIGHKKNMFLYNIVAALYKTLLLTFFQYQKIPFIILGSSSLLEFYKGVFTKVYKGVFGNYF